MKKANDNHLPYNCTIYIYNLYRHKVIKTKDEELR